MLTKSDYNKFLQCIKYLWLNKYRKDLLVEITEQQQAVFDQGYQVEDYAHRLFPEGTESAKDLFESERETVKLIAKKTPVIYQATAVADFDNTKRLLLCRTDIIVYNEQTKSYDIYEVKSTTQAKPEHLPDIAFQKFTFQKAGYNIGKTHLIHLNNQYVRQGDIDPQKLLTIVDLTEQIDAIIPQIEAHIPEANAILKRKTTEPQVRIIKQCTTPYTCPFIPYCWDQAKIPEYSVYNLTGIREDKLTQLLDLGVMEIKDIPEDFPLTTAQAAQVQVEKTGEYIINQEEINEALAELTYPLAFLDYETINPAIPLWDGTRPYQQVCFQYSLHVQRTPKAPLEHYEHLADGQRNPMPELLQQLKKDITTEGSVIVWSKSFEMNRNKEMAALYPEHQKFLEDINTRVFDLYEIFRNRDYVAPGFNGKASVKSVLRTLIPELSHKNLEDIQEGSLASLRWLQITFGTLPTAEKTTIRQNLLKYCERDTLAMVRILEEVR